MLQLHNKKYNYSPDKDLLLIDGRGICFQDIVDIITSNNALGIKKHPNSKKYPTILNIRSVKRRCLCGSMRF